MKYKEGDKVVVRTDLEIGKDYGNVRFVEGMKEYLGQFAIIEHVLTTNYAIDITGLAFSEEMLEPIGGTMEEKIDKEDLNEAIELEIKRKKEDRIKKYRDSIIAYAESELQAITEIKNANWHAKRLNLSKQQREKLVKEWVK